MRWLVVVVAGRACGDSTPHVARRRRARCAAIRCAADVRRRATSSRSPAWHVPAHVDRHARRRRSSRARPCATSVDAPYGIESAGPDSVVRARRPRRRARRTSCRLASASGPRVLRRDRLLDATGPARERVQAVRRRDVGRRGGRPVRRERHDARTWSSTTTSRTAAATRRSRSTSIAEQCTRARSAAARRRCVATASASSARRASTARTPRPPRCDTATNTCIAGMDTCPTDDTGEPANDGPAGAPAIVLAAGGTASTGAICSIADAPRRTTSRSTSTRARRHMGRLARVERHARSRSRGVRRQGTPLGCSFWEQPEHVRLTYLPVGRYYARGHRVLVRRADAVDRRLHADGAARPRAPAARAAADCAAEYRNQIFRGDCDAGACVSIEGNGAVPEGGACDSVSDCGSRAVVPELLLRRERRHARRVRAQLHRRRRLRAARHRATCARRTCSNNFCVQKCTADAPVPDRALELAARPGTALAPLLRPADGCAHRALLLP